LQKVVAFLRRCSGRQADKPKSPSVKPI
jgi:hypothetical protein